MLHLMIIVIILSFASDTRFTVTWHSKLFFAKDSTNSCIVRASYGSAGHWLRIWLVLLFLKKKNRLEIMDRSYRGLINSRSWGKHRKKKRMPVNFKQYTEEGDEKETHIYIVCHQETESQVNQIYFKRGNIRGEPCATRNHLRDAKIARKS